MQRSETSQNNFEKGQNWKTHTEFGFQTGIQFGLRHKGVIIRRVVSAQKQTNMSMEKDGVQTRTRARTSTDF